MATADAGYLSKRIIGAVHRRVVTHEKPMETRLPVGLPTTTSDRDNVGAVLSRPAGEFPAGTILTASKLQKLEDGQEKNTEALKKIQDEMGRLPCSKCEDDPPSN